MKFRKILAVLTLMLMIGCMVLSPALAANQERININTASVKQLMQLKNIGESYAARIVSYREKNGPFKSVDDLKKVKGIGSKTIDLNRNRLTVE